jgi:hypothetical protein
MKRTLTTAALLALMAGSVYAQPTNNANMTGNGAQSPDTSRPDGAKGAGAGTPGPAAAGASKMSKDDRDKMRADKKADSKAARDTKSDMGTRGGAAGGPMGDGKGGMSDGKGTAPSSGSTKP